MMDMTLLMKRYWVQYKNASPKQTVWRQLPENMRDARPDKETAM